MTGTNRHRLDGLEPDNVLAFLALLGALRALEADGVERAPEEKLFARACWDLGHPPLRPVLVLSRALNRDLLLDAICRGLDALAIVHEFGGRKDLNYSRQESRTLLTESAQSSRAQDRERVDLLSALMSDAALKDRDKEAVIDPTPFCLLFGQGHQHFLERLAAVPRQPSPPLRGRQQLPLAAPACLSEALFEPWHRKDPSSSFRWDPTEDVRYALRAGDPTDGAYKAGTQHGANRLAAVGLVALPVVPEFRARRIRPAVVGGHSTEQGFFFSWPIWRDPASLVAIRALLSHPDLHNPSKVTHLGVDHVVTAKRISVSKFLNFTRGRTDVSWGASGRAWSVRGTAS